MTIDPHCFDADPDAAQNLYADLDPDSDPDGGGGGVGQPKMCIPPGKILGTPQTTTTRFSFLAVPRNPVTKYTSLRYVMG